MEQDEKYCSDCGNKAEYWLRGRHYCRSCTEKHLDTMLTEDTTFEGKVEMLELGPLEFFKI